MTHAKTQAIVKNMAENPKEKPFMSTATKSKYSAQYKDPRWQKKRLEILEVFGWKCAKCEREDQSLHVHHLYYVPGRYIWKYPPIAFQVLCEDCHNETHFKKDANTFRYYFEIVGNIFLQDHSGSKWVLILEQLADKLLKDRSVLWMALHLSLRIDCGMQSAIKVIKSLPEGDRWKFSNEIAHEDFWVLHAKLCQNKTD